jgi:hypothetical protein
MMIHHLTDTLALRLFRLRWWSRDHARSYQHPIDS